MTAADVLKRAKAGGVKITTAESCTGGLIAAALTDLAGSSAVFDRGFVTYSNEAKSDLLNVAPAMIEAHGAVSREVAQAMAVGALANANASLSVAVTGIAGPGGGTPQKPVGLVYIASATPHRETVVQERTFGQTLSRSAIRQATVQAALALLAHQLDGWLEP